MTAPPPSEPYLADRARFGIKFGLETMRALTAELGEPQRGYPCLLVAGTNGKGSVAAYLDAALRASGLDAGRYTSPHLVRVHERITVGGRDITGPELDEAVGRVRQAAERLVDRGTLLEHPTYFEVLTAAAFDHFRRREVEVAVLEVGLGGRLDATNVCEPLASAIVSVDLDHETYLGTDLESIAREKAGVMRPGAVTVLGPLRAEARKAIGAQAAALGARLVDAHEGVAARHSAGGLDVRTPEADYRALRPLPGAHQRENLVVALRLLEAARAAGLRVDLARVAEGVASTRWPGRLQEVAGEVPLLLDGAHNPAAARALAHELRGRRPFVLLFGAMADKDVPALARTLFPLARQVVLTRVAEERAAWPDDVAARAGEVAQRAHRETDLPRALALARSLARPGETVVVAGSLYLVGAVLALLQDRAS